MSQIDISHPHSLPKAQARQAIEDVARKLQERFDVTCGWDGDAMHFSKAGVDGRILMQDDALHVTAQLGFLAAMFKEKIEAEIRRVLGERF